MQAGERGRGQEYTSDMKCETRELDLFGICDDILLTWSLLSLDSRQLLKGSEFFSVPRVMKPWGTGGMGRGTEVKTFALVFRSLLTNQKQSRRLGINIKTFPKLLLPPTDCSLMKLPPISRQPRELLHILQDLFPMRCLPWPSQLHALPQCNVNFLIHPVEFVCTSNTHLWCFILFGSLWVSLSLREIIPNPRAYRKARGGNCQSFETLQNCMWMCSFRDRYCVAFLSCQRTSRIKPIQNPLH